MSLTEVASYTYRATQTTEPHLMSYTHRKNKSQFYLAVLKNDEAIK